MTDLKQRAEAFAKEHHLDAIKASEGFSVLFTKKDDLIKDDLILDCFAINAYKLITEIRFARENPPTNVRPQHGWQSALDHVLSLLGAGESPKDGGKHEEGK